MRFLLDTNCWMQVVRERSQAEEVRALLDAVPNAHLATTIFTVHGLGVLMDRHGLVENYAAFMRLMSIGVDLEIVHVEFGDLARVAVAASLHELDFDDAYQYVAAELHGLNLVSLDADFDGTPNGRLTPAQALQRFKNETPLKDEPR